MDLIPCYCNWDIPGVDALPAHLHPASVGDRYVDSPRSPDSGPFAGVPYKMRVPDPDKEPRFWVEWKAVARAIRMG